MRTIAVAKWLAKDMTGKEIEESTLVLLNAILNMQRPETLPRGLENFRLFNRLHKAFEIAEVTGTLDLEEKDFAFLKSAMERDVPAPWGLSPNITSAIEVFISTEETK